MSRAAPAHEGGAVRLAAMIWSFEVAHFCLQEAFTEFAHHLRL